MKSIQRVLTTVAAIAVAGCGTSTSSGAPDQGLLGNTGGAVAATSATGRAGAPPEPGTAALNRRLLEQAARAPESTDLPVGPGDLLEVSVFEVEELSRLRVRIPNRGIISLPLVGQIRATDRTTSELEEEIRSRLQKKYMHDPQVSVFLQEHNSQRISVIGAVRKGGVINLNRPLRLADALALAEGLTDDADRRVYVIRRVPMSSVPTSMAEGAGPKNAPASKDGTAEVMAPIDLSELANGRDDLNIELRAGDVVHVPRAGSVYIGGSVEHPGPVLLKGKTTVQQAILAAGGVKDVANWSDIRLYRKSESGKVDVTTYDLDHFEEGKPAPEVQRDDVIVVGKSPGKAFFYGFLDFFRGALGVAKGI